MCSKRDLGKLSQTTLMCVCVSGERERKKNLHFVISRLTYTEVNYEHAEAMDTLVARSCSKGKYSAISIVTEVCSQWVLDSRRHQNDSANECVCGMHGKTLPVGVYLPSKLGQLDGNLQTSSKKRSEPTKVTKLWKTGYMKALKCESCTPTCLKYSETRR